ncbi:SPL family radical SAM protein [Desulfosoma caldarium]|uniref:Spore photoproduct lyase n=1 Tax=Desulfosoma caldarium TaxID=610254 RepID=A0A3N1ULY6_9BACT|nr:DNA photolyase [Desulfosoma caldarium]ROQ90738.1 spore photoproduct lyase [Desulfosoma caldarium]
MKPTYKTPITHLIVEHAVAKSPVVRTLRERLPRVPVTYVDKIPESHERTPGLLEVVHYKGRFWRSCPGTKIYECCGYQIVHIGTQCNLDCTYCILQAYFESPNLRIFGNLDDLLAEVQAVPTLAPHRLFRAGTGEFTDSLLLDPWTGLSQHLVPLFGRLPNAVLELKTKTDHVAPLKDLDHRGHTLVSWSLNAEEIIRTQEPRSAPLKARLRAAQRCAQWGYFLGFHFDPMIEYPGWREGYRRTLQALFHAVDPARVVWISVGAFRFMPELKRTIHRNHPRSRITTGEFIRGLDGKMRYFRDIRLDLYRWMVEELDRWDPTLCVYLCMEGPWIWKRVFGLEPAQKGGLSAMLDKAVKDRMGIEPQRQGADDAAE